MNQKLNWLNHPAIKQAEIARRLSISTSLFSNKLHEKQYKRFNEEELEKLELIRQELIHELV